MPLSIRKSTQKYERWLKSQLRGQIVEDDLNKKHEKMGEAPFVFLRATYWRWAETICDICPEFARAPSVLAVGDIHLENFGVWRDADGRLAWGINDFDEAARMPYALDLLRLAVSASLAREPRHLDEATICACILDGYARGLKAPQAFVLDHRHDWLRRRFDIGDDERREFWDDIEKRRAKGGKRPRRRYRAALAGAMPDRRLDLTFWPRSAGTGSLGRPRWVGYALWRGAPVVREAKAVVASAWSLPAGRGRGRIRCGEIANGRFRAPDPWHVRSDRTVVRRLSSGARKLEIGSQTGKAALLDRAMLRAMGQELANVHLGTAPRPHAVGKRILADLRKRRRKFLGAVRRTAEFVTEDHRRWRAVYRTEEEAAGKSGKQPKPSKRKR